MKNSSLMDPTDLFVDRHIGSPEDQLRAMLATLGFDSLDELSDATVPADIRMQRPLELHHRPWRRHDLAHVPGPLWDKFGAKVHNGASW